MNAAGSALGQHGTRSACQFHALNTAQYLVSFFELTHTGNDGGMRPWATSSTASASCCLVQYLEQVDHLDHQALTSLIGDSAGGVGARGSGRIPLVVLPYSVLPGVSSE